MPNGLGKISRVLVFTDESNHELALKSGADIIGDKNTINDVSNNNNY